MKERTEDLLNLGYETSGAACEIGVAVEVSGAGDEFDIPAQLP